MIYSYKSAFISPNGHTRRLTAVTPEISGAISSLAPVAEGLLGSTSSDGYLRLHSTFPPPDDPKGQQDSRGEVVAAHYLKTFAAVLACHPGTVEPTSKSGDARDEEADDVWAGMQEVEDADDAVDSTKRQRKEKA